MRRLAAGGLNSLRLIGDGTCRDTYLDKARSHATTVHFHPFGVKRTYRPAIRHDGRISLPVTDWGRGFSIQINIPVVRPAILVRRGSRSADLWRPRPAEGYILIEMHRHAFAFDAPGPNAHFRD